MAIVIGKKLNFILSISQILKINMVAFFLLSYQIHLFRALTISCVRWLGVKGKFPLHRECLPIL